MNTIMLSNIIVPNSFAKTHPSEKKMDSVRKYVEKHGEIDKPIVLDGIMLTDNYVRYLVAVEFGMEKVPCITSQEYRERKIVDTPTTYIIGKFNGNDKEYTWKLTKDIDVNVGDRVLVRSKCKNGKNGNKAVTVVQVFTSDSPRMLRHKPVVKKLRASSKEVLGD
ncbi:MAG: hypothetical protein IKW51_08625 [Bacteroidales bacterium]|nr:hypothetical protein [Bacteroidales bacterium]